MRKYFLLSAIILSTSLAASIDCNVDNSQSIKSQHYIQSSLSQDAINCSFVQDIHLAVDQAGQLFQSSPDIFLHIKDRTSNASFDQGYVLSFLQTYIRSNRAGEKIYRSGSDVLPILIHEYGHAIIRDRWENAFPEFSKSYNLARQLSLNTDEVTEISIGLKDGIYSLEEQRIKRGRRFALNMQARQLIKKIENTSDVLADLIPYNELLADIITVYFFDDKDAIFKSIDHPNFTAAEKGYALSRSFSVAPEYEIEKENVHTLLRRVRYHIGNNYMAKSSEEKLLFFRKISTAVENEIQRIYFDFEDDSTIANDLIIAIDKEFLE